MKRSSLVFALVAGTFALSACSHLPAAGPEVVTSVQDSKTFDLKSADKAALSLGLDYKKNGLATQSFFNVQFKEEVKYYLVKLVCDGTVVGPANGFNVDVNPDRTSQSKVTFFNLPKGSYDIYVTAVDYHGVILNKSGQADLMHEGLEVRAHGIASPPQPMECTIILRDDHTNLPSSLIEKSIKAISTLVTHLGEPMQTSLIPKRSPEMIPIVLGGPNPSLVKDTNPSFDDETHLTLSDASIEAMRLFATPPYLLFTTDEFGGNPEFKASDIGIITERDVTHVDPSLDGTSPQRILRFALPGVGTRNMYFTDGPNNMFKAASGFYDNANNPNPNTPPSYMRVDPELVSTTELFYSARYPNGVAANRYIVVDVEGHNWNIWTLNEDGITKIIGMAMPYFDGAAIKLAHLQLLPNTPVAP